MEKRSLQPTPNNDDREEISRHVRDVAPGHYIFKIDSFSLLSKILSKETDHNYYESRFFEAADYKWKLSLYPNGDEKRNGKDHISLFLAIADASTLPPAWEININFKFFVYDQLRDNYLTIQDRRERRFHVLKREYGFPQLLPLSIFTDTSNGYLINDCCVFGVEIFVIKAQPKGESFSIISDPDNCKCTWKIDKFSGLKEIEYYSAVFSAGGCQWKLTLYPRGNSSADGKAISLFLALHNHSVLHSGWKIYVECTLCIRNQLGGEDLERTYHHWFDASTTNWGYPNFMSLSILKNSSKGYLVNDTLILEGKIISMSVVKDLF